jgi:DNA-binding transcriptional ArsR family regulator
MIDNKDNNIQIKRLSHDEQYYTNVFKRTEKLVSVTFYILSFITQTPVSETHTTLIRDRALRVHEIALKTLSLQHHEIPTGLSTLQYALFDLDSTLRVATAAGIIQSDLHFLIAEQVDSVQRFIGNHYLKQAPSPSAALSTEPVVPGLVTGGKRTPVRSESTTATPVRRARKVNIPAGDISSDAYLVYSKLTDRAERIKTVLEAKPQATIKDIAEIITDVSEKTIQRELNSLIEKGQVLREGERRWSRYSVIK